MACTTIHLAIAKKYCELHPEENTKEFYLGSNVPDVSSNKNLTHYGKCCKNMTLYADYAKNKVNLNTMVKFVELNNSLNKGIFMHLISDYVFFNDIKLKQNKQILNSISLKEASHLSNTDYDVLTDKLIKKYEINLNDIPPKLLTYINKPIRNHLLFYVEEEIYKYIDRMSKINLQKVYDDIKKGIIDFYDIDYLT